jgi:hypothetical protein
MLNGEAKTPLALRRDGKGKIWSYIRQNWFVEFPEEVVRQEFVCHLVNGYGFSLDQMGEELEVQRGRQSAEADIVIWRTAQDKRDAKPPLIVAECKADNVAISPKDYGQGESYARIVDAPFFAKVREQLLAEAAAAREVRSRPGKEEPAARQTRRTAPQGIQAAAARPRSQEHPVPPLEAVQLPQLRDGRQRPHGPHQQDEHDHARRWPRPDLQCLSARSCGSGSFIEVGLSELELSWSSCRVKSIK